VYRQSWYGGTEEGKKGGVDKREEEDIMGKIDEIRRVTNERWKASVS
jgi:hypothetical protein